MNDDYIRRKDAIAPFAERERIADERAFRGEATVKDALIAGLSHAAVKILDAIPAADVRPVVLCRDCKHAPEQDPDGPDYGVDVRFPDDACPFKCGDTWYNVRPSPEFFCKNGERREAPA